jgi:hypothetical protein
MPNEQQAQAWLKSEGAKKTLRENPELKEEFSGTAAARKMRAEHGALIAKHGKSLQNLQGELAKVPLFR